MIRAFGPRADLPHDYTPDDLDRLAKLAVHTNRWHRAADYIDRLETAWSAIAEALYAAEHWPSEPDLARVGRLALDRAVRADMHAHGVSHHDLKPAREYHRFWWSQTAPTPSHEHALVDRLALTQIWSRLPEQHRATLAALAVHGTYEAAALSMGKGYSTFVVLVNRARRRFRELWHEGEAPSRFWGTDRRVGKRGGVRATSRKARTLTGRRRRQERAA